MIRQLLPGLLLALSACSPGDTRAAGPTESRTYDLKGFDKVKAAAGVSLKLAQGPFSIAAETQGGDLSHLAIELRGTELSIFSQSHPSFGPAPIYVVSVTAPDFKAISASAGVKVLGENLNLGDVSVDISAGVDAKLSGVCNGLTADVTAGAVLRAKDLRCADVTVTASAGAVADVDATQSAKASGSAGAKISIYGHPATIDKTADIAAVIDIKNN